MNVIAGTSLDEFLDGSSSSGSAERIQQVGLFGSMLGLTLALGVVVFLATVHRGRRREIGVLLQTSVVAGVIAAVGAAVELAGLARLDDVSWLDALTGRVGAPSMMRFLAGILIAFGLFEHTTPVGEADGQPIVRWIPAAASSFAYVGLAVGTISFWFDGHTVTKGWRVVHAAVNTVHVGAAGLWFGGIVGLLIVALLRRGGSGGLAELVVRFSTVATLALIGVFVAGVLMTLMITDTPSDLTSTDWGRTLLVKSAAVAVVIALGAYNHFVVVPSFERGGDGSAKTDHLSVTLTVETGVLVAVVALSVLLTTSSTV